MDKTAMHAEAADMLRDARAYIEKHGWVKGMERHHNGAVCLHRALREVDGTKHPKEVDAEVRRIVLNHVPVIYPTIPSFNDAQSTTKQEVLDLLLACEVIEREIAGA